MDRMNTRCLVCKQGEYVETTLHDDWDGVLHCNKCNHEVVRYYKKLEAVKKK